MCSLNNKAQGKTLGFVSNLGRGQFTPGLFHSWLRADI